MLCAVVAVALVAVAGDAPAAASQKRSAQLRSFGSCTELVRYARHTSLRAMRGRDAPGWLRRGSDDSEDAGGGEGGAERLEAPSEESFSGTNVQELGVDEPDIVKTDGARLFTTDEDGRLWVADIRGPQPVALGSLALGRGGPFELLLRGDRLLVLSSDGYDRTQAREVDVSDPAAPRVVRSLTMEGAYSGARMSGGTVRLALTTYERVPMSVRSVRRARRAAAWLPRATVRRAPGARAQRRKLVDCDAVRRTRSVTGMDVATVVTLGLDEGLVQLDADAVMTDAETIYASRTAFYVATYDWNGGRTGVHRFDASDPARTEYSGSGSVPGRVLNQWSLSEHEGDLRIATTVERQNEEPSESRITVLRQSAGALAPVGLVTGLGRTEEIYGVRYVGDVAFVVTFRQIDPLYTVDLAEPTHPRVVGELKIPGFSTYLHPVGEDLLLGVGQSATDEGETRGTQLSLFDVSDLAAPRRVVNLELGRGYDSPAEYDHRAFLFWPQTGLVVVPLTRYTEEWEPAWSGAGAFRVGRRGARVGHPHHASARGPHPALAGGRPAPADRVGRGRAVERARGRRRRPLARLRRLGTTVAWQTRKGDLHRVNTHVSPRSRGDRARVRAAGGAGRIGAVHPGVRRPRRPVLPARRERRLRRQALHARPRLRAEPGQPPRRRGDDRRPRHAGPELVQPRPARLRHHRADGRPPRRRVQPLRAGADGDAAARPARGLALRRARRVRRLARAGHRP